MIMKSTKHSNTILLHLKSILSCLYSSENSDNETINNQTVNIFIQNHRALFQ